MYSNSITILSVDGVEHRCTKTFEKLDTGEIVETGYNAGTVFERQQYEVSNIFELSDMLLCLEPHNNCFIIRGCILPEYQGRKLISRTNTIVPSKNQIAYFGPYPKGLNWIMIDFDKRALPAGMSPRDGVEFLVKQLPKEFHSASYHYQLSSSAGVYGWETLSAHVFFWLSKPEIDMKPWGMNFNATHGEPYVDDKGKERRKRIFDPSTLNMVQPNYVSKPIFIGMDDPLPTGRSGLVNKTTNVVDLVSIPPPKVYVEVEGKMYEAGSTITKAGVKYKVTPSFQDRLDDIGHPYFLAALLSATGCYARLHGTQTDPMELKRRIRQHWQDHVANLAGAKRGDYISDSVLDPMIQSAIAKYGTGDPVVQKSDTELKEKLIRLRSKTSTPLYHYSLYNSNLVKTSWLEDYFVKHEIDIDELMIRIINRAADYNYQIQDSELVGILEEIGRASDTSNSKQHN